MGHLMHLLVNIGCFYHRNLLHLGVAFIMGHLMHLLVNIGSFIIGIYCI
jgi:hypothetical protein